jgi:hypothetical protein
LILLRQTAEEGIGDPPGNRFQRGLAGSLGAEPSLESAFELADFQNADPPAGGA